MFLTWFVIEVRVFPPECVLLLLYECVFLCYIFRLCVTFCTCVSNLIWFTILEQGKILSHFLLSNFWRILVEISLLENCVMDFSNKELLKLIFKINSTCILNFDKNFEKIPRCQKLMIKLFEVHFLTPFLKYWIVTSVYGLFIFSLYTFTFNFCSVILSYKFSVNCGSFFWPSYIGLFRINFFSFSDVQDFIIKVWMSFIRTFIFYFYHHSIGYVTIDLIEGQNDQRVFQPISLIHKISLTTITSW